MAQLRSQSLDPDLRLFGADRPRTHRRLGPRASLWEARPRLEAKIGVGGAEGTTLGLWGPGLRKCLPHPTILGQQQRLATPE